jgi:hypothetical protein
MPSFQSAAILPPISRRNPTKYMLAHFMTHLLIRPDSCVATGLV